MRVDRRVGGQVLLIGGAVLLAVAGVGITAAATTATSSLLAVAASPSTWAAPRAVPELAIGPVRTITSGQDIFLPVDTYKANPTSEDLVLKAEYQVMKSCMARYGIVFGAPPATWTVPATNHDYDRLFGLIDLPEARKYGYHSAEKELPDGEAAPRSAPVSDPNESAPNYLAVAMGDPSVSKVNGLTVPHGGCVTEARSTLGDTPTAQTLTEKAIGYGLSQSDADRRVIARFSSWSACMKNAGFSYGAPMDAIGDPQWGTETASATELKAAAADVECKTATNLTGLRVAVAAAWQNRYITAHAAQFSAIRPGFGQQVAKANAILQKK